MALFGVQLVLTMIIASFLHKLAPYYSLGRWLVTFRIHRYLPPSDKLLRPHMTAPSQSSKATKKKAANQREKILASPKSTPEELMAAINYDPNGLDQNQVVPKSIALSLKLDSSPLKWDGCVGNLHYSREFEIIVNLTLASVFVYCATYIYFHIKPSAMTSEYNLSVIWLLLVVSYTFKVLFSLTVVYLSDEEFAHQRSLIIVFTTLFFVLALIVLVLDESFLDFGLERSHEDLSRCLSILLEGVSDRATDIVIPMWFFKIVLAILCSVLSMVMVFPGFRFADTHFNTVYSHAKALFLKTFLNANYTAPMLALSLWIRPFEESMVAGRNGVNFFGAAEVSYDTFRIILLVSVCALRLALFRTYLQSYLDSAKWRVESLKHEQGKLTILQLRKRVKNVFLFYAALALQYLAPYIILLSLTLLMVASSLQSAELAVYGPSNKDVSLFARSGFGLGLFDGCIGFICWWVCLTITVTTGLGVVIKDFI